MPLHTDGITSSITAQKQAEALMKKGEEQFRLTFEQAAIGMAITTLDGKFKRVNRALCDALGYSIAEMQEKSYVDILHPDDLAVAELLHTQLLTGQISQPRDEKTFLTKDGKSLRLIEQVVLVKDTQGKPLHFLRQLVDITGNKSLEASLLHHPLYDPLTGLPNRQLFLDRLGQAIKRTTRRPNYFFAALFLDLENFQVVRDGVKYPLGEQFLVAIARKLEACLRPADTVARLSKDQFVVLLEDIQDVKYAVSIAERIYRELTGVEEVEGETALTSPTINIITSNLNYQQPATLLRDAALAMDWAKATERSRNAILDQATHTQILKRLHQENNLRQALARKELLVYYQPIISLVTGYISGFEALIRWRHPQKGLITPNSFLPLAEANELIIPIGEFVLRQACQQMQQWQRQFLTPEPLRISVNLSSQQLRDPYLLALVDKILVATELGSRWLKLEITESMLLEDLEKTRGILSELRARDIQISIGHFGTGEASCSYLEDLPLNSLKIHRSLVNQMESNPENYEMVAAIVKLAHSLQLDVIAEGVENVKQLNILRSLGCQKGQGYYFSKPLDAQAAADLLKSFPQW